MHKHGFFGWESSATLCTGNLGMRLSAIQRDVDSSPIDLRGHCSYNRVNDVSPFEDHDSGYAHHFVSSGELLVFVCVDFHEFRPARVFPRKRFNDRTDDSAGTTPVGVEVHDRRNLRVQNFAFEVCSAQMQ